MKSNKINNSNLLVVFIALCLVAAVTYKATQIYEGQGEKQYNGFVIK